MKAIRLFVFLLVAAITLSARADSYSWSNLQSDIAGAALHTDRDLVNPWGLTASSNGTIWAADNGTGVSTLYRQDGSKVSLTVTIPTSARNKDGGNPTGVVFNSTAFFKVTKNGNSQPARFIFVSEDGTISGWNARFTGMPVPRVARRRVPQGNRVLNATLLLSGVLQSGRPRANGAARR